MQLHSRSASEFYIVLHYTSDIHAPVIQCHVILEEKKVKQAQTSRETLQKTFRETSDVRQETVVTSSKQKYQESNFANLYYPRKRPLH